MAALVKTCRTCGREFAQGETYCPTDGTRLLGPGQMQVVSDPAEPLVGQTLDGRYRILAVIGQGGMGIVYEAEHVLIEKRVAVKVLRQDFTRKPDVVERFKQEARSASKIGHPNIIDVIDFGETPSGASYFVMEKLDGEDLAEVLCRECVLAPARAVNVVYQCCRALAAAHAKGIFHRDLKPENLFLVRTQAGAEAVKIVDFGVAKMSDRADEVSGSRRLTRTGMLFGTPEYMSPEQARGMPLDHRADIYALGIILYELVTGRVPFEGTNFMEVLSKHGTEPLPELTVANPGTIVSESLRSVVIRALCKDREKRYQSMDEMADALAAVPEMPAVVGDSPPPWALAVPASPTEGLTRQRISVQPIRKLRGGPLGVFWDSLGARGRWWVGGGGVALSLLGLGAYGLRSQSDGVENVPAEESLVGITGTSSAAATAPGVPAPEAGSKGTAPERAPNTDSVLAEGGQAAAPAQRADAPVEMAQTAHGRSPLGRETVVLSPDARPLQAESRVTILPGVQVARNDAQSDDELPSGSVVKGSSLGPSSSAGGGAVASVGRSSSQKGTAEAPAVAGNVGARAGSEVAQGVQHVQDVQKSQSGQGAQEVEVDPAEDRVDRVRLQVMTRPSGARVLPGEDHPGCRATPCSVEVPRGSAVVLKARQGKARGSVRVVGRSSGQRVWVAMTRVERDPIPPPVSRDVIPPPLGPASRGRATEATSGQAAASGEMGGVSQGGDLKVPDIFR